jgi:hypothetical protein
MPESNDTLTLAEPRDLADAIAFALQFEGRKRVHHADEYMAAIAAKRVVRPGASRFRRCEEPARKSAGRAGTRV